MSVIKRRGWFGSAGRYELETNAGRLGAKARFTLDERSGDILSAGYVPR
ncbi:MAG: hypothetical protein LCI02_13110 [Proteobacteria bacterium]|nr:hypothetical protein [Pseudomonadota bacterium]